ncbi:putative protease [Burkholderiales bacterium]|nr:putative protease [Burkholderiales bacterium]
MRPAVTPPVRVPELVCPAGALPALKAAVDHGADCVYVGFRDETNARAFAGLNFDDASLAEGIAYAHRRGRKVLVALNTFPSTDGFDRWTRAVDRAAEAGADAAICADAALLDYASRAHPQLRLHLSVQASATSHEAIEWYRERFGVRRAVLPRVLSLAQVEHTIARTGVEIEVFGYGSLCVMVEGRCALSAYATGESPNCQGVCSPAKAVRWEPHAGGMRTRLNGFLIDAFEGDERPGYPTLCKGRFDVGGEVYYALEEPTSLNTLDLLPELMRIGVAAIKIEGRQRSPAYVAQVTRVWRAAIDACAAAPRSFAADRRWHAELDALAEGQAQTLGAYSRPWR